MDRRVEAVLFDATGGRDERTPLVEPAILPCGICEHRAHAFGFLRARNHSEIEAMAGASQDPG